MKAASEARNFLGVPAHDVSKMVEKPIKKIVQSMSGNFNKNLFMSIAFEILNQGCRYDKRNIKSSTMISGETLICQACLLDRR